MSNDQYQAPLGQDQQPRQQQEQQAQQQHARKPARKPEDTVRDGSIKASIWRREGQKNDFFTTELAKTFRMKDGTLKDTHSFNKDELLRVAEVARRAHNRVSELTRAEFKRHRQSAQSKTREQAGQKR